MEEAAKVHIPKGIYFEDTRKRWRVRLYKEGAVVHLSYHRSFEHAMEGWLVARSRQRRCQRRHITPAIDTMQGLLQTLSAALHPQYTYNEHA